jgi:hypothetical protein
MASSASTRACSSGSVGAADWRKAVAWLEAELIVEDAHRIVVVLRSSAELGLEASCGEVRAVELPWVRGERPGTAIRWAGAAALV